MYGQGYLDPGMIRPHKAHPEPSTNSLTIGGGWILLTAANISDDTIRA
jgi:hypothetical protein